VNSSAPVDRTCPEDLDYDQSTLAASRADARRGLPFDGNLLFRSGFRHRRVQAFLRVL
jgi:hypothetical protein